jgi:hypothetical protein
MMLFRRLWHTHTPAVSSVVADTPVTALHNPVQRPEFEHMRGSDDHFSVTSSESSGTNSHNVGQKFKMQRTKRESDIARWLT